MAGVGLGNSLGLGKGLRDGAGDAVSVVPNTCGAPTGAGCFGIAAGALAAGAFAAGAFVVGALVGGAIAVGAFVTAFVAGVVPALGLAKDGGLSGGGSVPAAPSSLLMTCSTTPVFGETVGRGV